MSKRLHTLLALPLLLTLPMSASSQDGPGGRPPGERRGGPPGGGPGGPGGGFGGKTLLVEKFDRDGDGRLDRQEREAAREFLKEERAAGRGRRGFPRRRGEPAEPPEPGPRLSPEDVSAYPEAGLYDTSVLRTLFLTFESDDWEAEMADFNNTDVEVPATLQVDGKTYRDVGVHFRGASSFGSVSAGFKRSLNLSLDFVHDDQRLKGYCTLNLLNSHGDPSFLRSFLYSVIARDYLPAPRVNFVRVVIQGESWGVYVNSEQFNRDFTRDHFGTRKGDRWKTPGSPRGRATLGYLGDDPEDYRGVYSLRSKEDPEAWKALIELTRVISETPIEELPEALEPLLDVEGALRFLAVENALINNDGYWTRASDYNLYRDVKGRFHLVPHDMNEAFQAPGRFGRRGRGGPGGGGLGRGQTTMAIITRTDGDGDGKLTLEEFSSLAAAVFGEEDSRDLRGFTRSLGAALSPRPAGGEERRRGRGRPPVGPEAYISAGIFRASDADSDGSVTREEFEKLLGRWFEEFSGDDASTLDERSLASGLRSKLRRGDFGPPAGDRGGNRGPGRGGPPGDRRPSAETGPRPVNLDPMEALGDESKVLISRLLKVPAYRKRYLDLLEDIARRWLDWETLGPIATRHHELIAGAVASDTRKLDSTEAFRQNLLETVANGGGFGGPTRMGIRQFAEARSKYLLERVAELRKESATETEED